MNDADGPNGGREGLDGVEAEPAPAGEGRESPRRDALKYGAAGLATAALGAAALLRRPQGAEAATRNITLFVNAGDAFMIDGTPVYSWGFGDTRTSLAVRGPAFPGGQFPDRVILVREGDVVNVSITNTLDETHSFVVPGVVNSGVIRPRATKRLRFRAPRAGTYLYLDALNAPVNRVLGLHGVLVVMPRDGSKRPYPGGPTFRRQFVWILQAVDPAWGELARKGRPIDKSTCKPRYFMINDRSGIRSIRAADTVPKLRVGETTLIRLVNASPAVHSPHIHGNHLEVLTLNGEVLPIQMEKDTVMMRPLDRKDCILPAKLPPDAWPPTEESAYPMHCHTELSQTAAGGLYPSGMLADWELLGP